MTDIEIDVNWLNSVSKNTISEHLGIVFTEIGEDFLCAKMPVDQRTKQPFGLLHGGASVVLAETLGSIGSYMFINRDTHVCVGLEINANHIKSAKEGFVYGRATVISLGKKIHVWDIRITNENNKLVCVSRLTVAVLEKK